VILKKTHSAHCWITGWMELKGFLSHNDRMLICEAPPFILLQFGDLAITTRSIPSLIMAPVYLGVCLGLSIRHRVLGWADWIVVGGFVLLQLLLLRTADVINGAMGLPGYALLAPFMVFLAGYAVWRLAGGKPLARWPWYRFGFVSTAALLLADIGMAVLTPAAPGKVWQLGGACFRDALLLGPPFLVVVFYGLLDCHSSWVFCSRQCVRLGRCRFGMDGKNGGCRCAEGVGQEGRSG